VGKDRDHQGGPKSCETDIIQAYPQGTPRETEAQKRVVAASRLQDQGLREQDIGPEAWSGPPNLPREGITLSVLLTRQQGDRWSSRGSQKLQEFWEKTLLDALLQEALCHSPRFSQAEFSAILG
jgi:hypothetical protein